MRLTLALLFVAVGCNNGSGTTSDAATGDAATGDAATGDAATGDAATVADAGSDAPTGQLDVALDSPTTSPDGGSDAVMLDAGGDAGPFSCAAGLTCQANQYCEPQCCSGCFADDGGVCPTGATSCALGAGASGCNFCSAARCVNTIPFGCNPGGVGDPRRLYCLCG
jgi:hypothetical protein